MTNVEAQMLSTLEMLHYCQRFQGQLFAFCFENVADLSEVLTDLRVIHAAQIPQVLFSPPDAALLARLQLWNRAGSRFTVVEATPEDLHKARFIGSLQTLLSEGQLPLVTVAPFAAAESGGFATERAVMHCAVSLGARKVFFPGSVERLEIDGQPRSYPTPIELRQALDQNASLNLSRQRTEFLLEQLELQEVEIVLVAARRGAPYEEVFTHSGSGTLFTQDYPNVLRPATEADVRDIVAMMQPYVQEGSLRPVSEEELLQMVRSFLVYSVNGEIVAAGAVVDHGDSYEVGKLCTLPRYQARGRARDLVRAIQNKAREDGKRAVFALTVHDYVGRFFERLGFAPIERSRLPESWRENYDLSRPSKAYWYPCPSKIKA